MSLTNPWTSAQLATELSISAAHTSAQANAVMGFTPPWTSAQAAAFNVTPSDGTYGIFALGAASTTRKQYTFSGNTVAAATAATVASNAGAAAGNFTLGIFALGNNSANSVSTRDKYTWSGAVVSAATAASTSSAYGAACGTATEGIFALGVDNVVIGSSTAGTLVSTRDKYTYSSGTVGAAAAAYFASCYGAACGGDTYGIFQLGSSTYHPDITATTALDRYTYSNDTNQSGNILTAAATSGMAISNNTYGVIALGADDAFENITNVFTYSSQTCTASTNLTNGGEAGGGAGNSVLGIIGTGYQGLTNVYTFSSAAVVAGTSIAASGVSANVSACSNGIQNVN